MLSHAEEKEPVNVLVMGSGALGGYYGGLLARAGHDVTFIVRPSRLQELRRDGLRVESAISGDFTIPGTFAASCEGRREVDLVLFCVKSFDTEAAAEVIAPCIGGRTAILLLQNGVDNEELLAQRFGVERILGGTAQIEATLDERGTVHQLSTFARVNIGEWSGEPTPRTRALLDTLVEAGIDAHLVDDIRLALWQKFLFLCTVAGLTAATGCTIGQIVAMPETREVLQRALHEIDTVARAEGVAMPADAVENALVLIQGIPYDMKTSLQRDLENGRRLEVDALSGSVVRRGRHLGIDTPVHQTLLGCIVARAAASEPAPSRNAAIP